jgi:4-amino-4-deoxy-L-arabinose transferase-like glycosyltransferase
MVSARAPSRPRYAWLPVSALAILLLVIWLALANQYGFHRDELYFIVAGQHPDWGYVDQPPLTPLASAFMASLLGLSPLSVRILPALAIAVVIGVTAAIAREYGGGTRAQLISVAIASGSALLGLGHLDSTTTFDVLAWSLVTWLVIRLLRGADPRTWLLVGVVAGIGLQNKNLVVLLGIGLFIGLLLARRWEVLRTGWLWAGIGIAVLIWLPNVAWQAMNGWPQVGMSGVVSSRSSLGDAVLIVPFQLIMAGPLLWPLFLAGLWWLLRSPASMPWRTIGWAYLAALVVTIAVRGQVYYATGLYPAIFAACGVVADGWLSRGRLRLRAGVLSAAWAGSTALVALIMLPILTPAALAETPFPDLYDGSVEQVGWPDLVDTVTMVANDLPSDQRARAVMLTGNYGEAGALTLLGSTDLPPVYSGHNSFASWGPPPDDRDVTVLVGHWPQRPTALLGTCVEKARITNEAGVENEESIARVWVCTDRAAPWSQVWDELAFYG